MGILTSGPIINLFPLAFRSASTFGASHVVVQASDYQITVANDFQANASSPPTDQFVVNYTYFAAQNIRPQRLIVNGTEWAGDAILIFSISGTKADLKIPTNRN